MKRIIQKIRRYDVWLPEFEVRKLVPSRMRYTTHGWIQLRIGRYELHIRWGAPKWAARWPGGR